LSAGHVHLTWSFRTKSYRSADHFAGALKTGTYRQLESESYGEMKSATIESQKALARGSKEELADQFPQNCKIERERGRTSLGLDDALEAAGGMIQFESSRSAKRCSQIT
jgi:hypothetical protein